MNINPRMLTLAREARGLSQSQFADLIGITQGKVSKYENGLIAVSDEDLRAIADKLDFVPDFFVQTDQVHGPGSTFLYNRRRKTMPVSVQRRIIAQINVMRMQIERLLRGADIDCENRFEKLDIDSFDGHVEQIAQRVRAVWGLPPGPVVNLTTAIEAAGGVVVLCRFGTSKLDAAHLWLPGLPPLFFMNADMPGERHRFSLAHEIGHAIMHSLPSDDVESEADRFASELLMPAEEIGPQLVGLTIERAAKLKLQWKVSMQALIMRARQLGRITEQRYRTLYTQISALGYRRNEPFAIPLEPPTVVTQLIGVHHRHHGYTEDDLRRTIFTFSPLLDGIIAGGDPSPFTPRPRMRVVRIDHGRDQEAG